MQNSMTTQEMKEVCDRMETELKKLQDELKNRVETEVNKLFGPEYGNLFYYLTAEGEVRYHKTFGYPHPFIKRLVEAGNTFPTREMAEKKAKRDKLLAKLRPYLTTSPGERGFTVTKDTRTGELNVAVIHPASTQMGALWFKKWPDVNDILRADFLGELDILFE